MVNFKAFVACILLAIPVSAVAKDLSNTFLLCKSVESEKLRGVHFLDEKFVVDLFWWGANGDDDGFKRLNRQTYRVRDDHIMLCGSLVTWDNPTKTCRGDKVSYLIDRTTLDYKDTGLIGNETIRRCKISSFKEIKSEVIKEAEATEKRQLEKESKYKL